MTSRSSPCARLLRRSETTPPPSSIVRKTRMVSSNLSLATIPPCPTMGTIWPPAFGMERPLMGTKRRLLACAECKRPTPEIWRLLSRRAEVAAFVLQAEVHGRRLHPLRYQMAMLIQWTIDDNPFAEPRLSSAFCSCKGHSSHGKRAAPATTDEPFDGEPFEAPSEWGLGHAFNAARNEATLGNRARDGHASADRRGRERLIGRKRHAVAADSKAPVTDRCHCAPDESRSAAARFSIREAAMTPSSRLRPLTSMLSPTARSDIEWTLCPFLSEMMPFSADTVCPSTMKVPDARSMELT